MLVVSTPGVSRSSYLPLILALKEDGRDVHLVEFLCRDQDANTLAQSIASASATLPEGTPIVAHGLGATLALMANPTTPPSKYVLLAPVLSIQQVAITSWLSEQPVRAGLDLSTPGRWNDHAIHSLLLGGGIKLGCTPTPFARSVQRWIQTETVPVDLPQITAPVWIAVGLNDDIASVESTVGASRQLPSRTVIRMGINRMDSQDFQHGDMLTHAIPVRAAVRALKGK